MSDTRTIDQSSGVLEVHTGVAGRSARLGHRLVLAPTAWRAVVEVDGDRPVSLAVTVDAASLEVVSGEGGLTPLSAPERAVATANAHRSLKVKANPAIEYRSATIEASENGFRVRGELSICGTTRPCDFALVYEDAEPAPALATAVPVRQTDFGIKPFSLMMGTLQVADEVTVVAPRYRGRMPQTHDHARRRDTLRAALASHEPALDALLVTDLDNVRYLAGFTGSNGAVLVAADPSGDAIATDGRYLTQVAEQSGDLRAVIERDVAKALLAEADGTVGFEATALSYADHARLAPEASLVPTTRLVEALREVKDDGEIELLRRACAISDRALAALVEEGAIRPGATEAQVARRLENLMYEFGADAVAFETIVAAGPNSAIPHHRPTDAALATGDFVKIDFGARFRGYHADETRTFVLGEPAAWQREIYDLVRAAQTAGREALVPGADVRAIDGAARSVIEAAGYGEQFLHGLGHGVGVQIHEAPTLGKLGSGTLSDGAVVTVEPGVYLPGRGGVRIEDTLVVRADGPELLTRTTKDLIAL